MPSAEPGVAVPLHTRSAAVLHAQPSLHAVFSPTATHPPRACCPTKGLCTSPRAMTLPSPADCSPKRPSSSASTQISGAARTRPTASECRPPPRCFQGGAAAWQNLLLMDARDEAGGLPFAAASRSHALCPCMPPPRWTSSSLAVYSIMMTPTMMVGCFVCGEPLGRICTLMVWGGGTGAAHSVPGPHKAGSPAWHPTPMCVGMVWE